MSDRGVHEGPCLNYEGQRPETYYDREPCYLHIEASGRRWQAIEAIVRDLAAKEAPGDSEHYLCQLCEAELSDEYHEALIDEDRDDQIYRLTDWHSPSCEWRRAVEWARDTDQERRA